jgi:SAM-dependent methyltransferase
VTYRIDDAEQGWTSRYQQAGESWPSEALIRIFKGSYPRLFLGKNGYHATQSVLDIGCGDVGNLVFLATLGMRVSGVEIDQRIVDHVKACLARRQIDGDVRVGTNDNLPYGDAACDYLVSWNSAYYMGDKRDFESNVREFARILKPNGRLIMSLPKMSHVIFQGAEPIDEAYAVIRVDELGIRVGQTFRRFTGEADIERTLAPHFGNFSFGSIEDDCFGSAGHWHLVVCEKRP